MLLIRLTHPTVTAARPRNWPSAQSYPCVFGMSIATKRPEQGQRLKDQ